MLTRKRWVATWLGILMLMVPMGCSSLTVPEQGPSSISPAPACTAFVCQGQIIYGGGCCQ